MTDLNSAAAIDDTTLAEIVGFVWHTFAEEEGIEPGAPLPAQRLEACHYATISIGGTWTATLVVAMAPALIGHFASALMGVPAAELDVADIDDAFGELANVVGGNVKGLVDDPSATLSLPAVSASRPLITGGRLTVQVAYELDGEAMVWELWERV